jgi:hypothetical protein
MSLTPAVEKAAGVVAETNFCYIQIDNLPFLSSFSNNIVNLISMAKMPTFAHWKHSIIDYLYTCT